MSRLWWSIKWSQPRYSSTGSHFYIQEAKHQPWSPSKDLLFLSPTICALGALVTIQWTCPPLCRTSFPFSGRIASICLWLTLERTCATRIEWHPLEYSELYFSTFQSFVSQTVCWFVRPSWTLRWLDLRFVRTVYLAKSKTCRRDAKLGLCLLRNQS